MFYEVLGPQCSTRGIAYVAVGMAVGSVFHHSLAFHMLKPPKGEVIRERGELEGVGGVDKWALVVDCRSGGQGGRGQRRGIAGNGPAFHP